MTDDTANLIARLQTSYVHHPRDDDRAAIGEAIDTIERLSQQEAGYIEQHGRDSAELRRLCGERDFERDLRASMAVELKEARIEIAGNEQRIAALESELADLKHDIASSLDSLTKEAEARIEAEDELAALANQEPVAWAIRIGDSDTWSYAGSESDADFYCKQSGLKCEKRPLFANPPAAAASEDARDAERWRAVSSILSADEIKDIAIIVAHERGVDVANAFNKTSEHLIDAAIAAEKDKEHG